MSLRYKTYLLSILLFCSTYLSGQNQSNNFEVQILSLHTQETLPGATAFNLNSKEGASANAEGILTVKKNKESDIIEFSYLGYRKKRYTYGDLPRMVYLEKDANILDNITIVSKKTPIALTNKSETAIDLAMTQDQIILLSREVGRQYVLRLLNLKGEQISTTRLKDIKSVQELYTSCFGSHFLIAKNKVLQLCISNNEIKIADKSTRVNFEKYIKPCKTQNENFIYYEKRSLKNQIASIYGSSKNGDEVFVFAGVADDENLKRYKHDAAYMNYADGTGPLHLGIHAENPRDALQWGDMLNRSFYLPVDYFMMSYKNKILLFDHEKCKQRILDEKGNLLKENDIDYPKQKGWQSKNNLYKDIITNKLFAVHRTGQNLTFTEIDLKTGKRIQSVKMKIPFVDNLCIHNSIIYYTDSTLTQSSRILNKIKL